MDYFPDKKMRFKQENILLSSKTLLTPLGRLSLCHICFRDSMEGEQEEFRRQLEFIIKQLNKTDEDRDGFDHDSDDEGDEDDDEVKSKKKIKSSFFSRCYTKACNEWWDPSPRLSA